jgi:hypothetical protein
MFLLLRLVLDSIDKVSFAAGVVWASGSGTFRLPVYLSITRRRLT